MSNGFFPERPVISEMDFEPPPVLESLIRPAKDMDGAAGEGDLGGCGMATTVTAGLVDFGTLVALALALSKDS